jgi:hypothetical protein
MIHIRSYKLYIYIYIYIYIYTHNFPEILAKFPLYSLDTKLSTQSFLNL